MNAPTDIYLGEDSQTSFPEVRSQEKRRMRFYAVLLAGDAGLLLGSFALAGLLYLGIWAEARAMLAGSLLLPLFLTLALYNRTYSLPSLTNLAGGIRRMLVALVISAALLNFITFFARASTQLSRATFATGFALTLVTLVAWRLIFRWCLARRSSHSHLSNTLIVDAGGPAINLSGAYRIRAENRDPSRLADDPILLDRLGRMMRNMDSVIVSCTYEHRPSWTLILKSSTATNITGMKRIQPTPDGNALHPRRAGDCGGGAVLFQRDGSPECN